MHRIQLHEASSGMLRFGLDRLCLSFFDAFSKALGNILSTCLNVIPSEAHVRLEIFAPERLSPPALFSTTVTRAREVFAYTRTGMAPVRMASVRLRSSEVEKPTLDSSPSSNIRNRPASSLCPMVPDMYGFD